MILPQSKTFILLKTRLDCVNITNFNLPFIDEEVESKTNREQEKQKVRECLTTFQEQQERFKKYIFEQSAVLMN